MQTKKKICVSCENETYIWSKSMCKSCFMQNNPNKPLKKSYISKKPTEKQIAKKVIKTENTKKLHNWFQELWNNEPHYSEISDKWLGHENNSCFWHHLYPKSKYPEYAFDRDNIIRLTADEHAECEANPHKYEIVVKKLEYLKQKYGIT